MKTLDTIIEIVDKFVNHPETKWDVIREEVNGYIEIIPINSELEDLEFSLYADPVQVYSPDDWANYYTYGHYINQDGELDFEIEKEYLDVVYDELERQLFISAKDVALFIQDNNQYLEI